MAKIHTEGRVRKIRVRKESVEEKTGCIEPVIKLNEVQQIIQDLNWIRFNLNKGYYSDNEIIHIKELLSNISIKRHI
jgi:hypothetical protein